MASDLVDDLKLPVRFSTKHTHHLVFDSDDRPGQQRRRQRREESWTRGKPLGKGGGGSVWLEHCLGVDSQSKARAVKAIPKQSSSCQTIDYRRELEAILRFSQKRYRNFFVRSFGWYEDANFAYIAMEYFELGDLQTCLTQPLPEDEAQQITSQILEGLDQLHERGYAHRDLKPANIFVVRGSPDWWVKIGDFGISKRVNDGQTVLRTDIGTHGFAAPEVYEDEPGSKYTEMVDIWSLGVLVHYMITKTLPFENKRTLSEYTRTSQFPPTELVTCNVSRECHDFVTKGLLSIRATSRLSAKDALQHQWLSGLYASPVSTEANEASSIQTGRAIEHINGRDTEMVFRTVSAADELTDASACWGANVGTERQLPVRTKHDATQGPHVRTTVVQQSSSAKLAPILDLPNELHRYHDEGILLMDQQQYPGAQILLQKAFELRKDTLGFHHEDTLVSLKALGDALCGQEMYAEAEAAYCDVWMRRKRAIGESHTDTLSVLDMLGKALNGQGKYAKAERVYRAAWKARKQAFGSQHEDTLAAFSAFGEFLYRQGRYEEAKVAYRDIWTRRKQAIGESHADTLSALDMLGKALNGEGEFVEAEGVYQMAWEARKQAIGEDHEDTLSSLTALCDSLSAQGKFAEAEAAYRDLWVRQMGLIGENHADTLSSFHMLSRALFDQGRYLEAEAGYRDTWEARRRVLGGDHEDTLMSLHWQGRAFYHQKAYAEAEAVLRDACEGRKRVLREQHSDISESMHWLGRAQYSQDKYLKAEGQFRTAWQGRNLSLGKEHPDTLESLNWLGLAAYFRDKYDKVEDQPNRV